MTTMKDRRTSKAIRDSLRREPSVGLAPFSAASGMGCSNSRGGVILSRHERAFFRLRRTILDDYSYRDLHPVNWEKQFKSFEADLHSLGTARQFAEEAVRVLNPAKDIHLWLKVRNLSIPTYRRCVERNISMEALSRSIPGWQQHNDTVISGKFPSGPLYLCLRRWPAHARERLELGYRVLRQAIAGKQPLIIDVRANGGGSEPLAALFAGCFIRHPVCYAKHLTRRAGKLLGPIERWLKPNRRRPHYSGPVAVLIGTGTVSSCESFVLMMRQVPGCKLIGQPTAGASGNPLPFDLGNGVVVYVPSWKDLDLDGVCIEGRGVAPDILVDALPSAFADPVLASALRFLRANKHR